MEVTVKSYPLNEINESFNVPNTYNSESIVKYLWVDVSQAVSDSYIEIVYNGVTKTLLITDECRYSPTDIAFQNKEGTIQIQTFFKTKKETISVESENFESSRTIGTHQFVKYNVNAKSKFTVSSGFIDEDKNEIVKQLLMTERAWVILGGKQIPVNVSTSTQEIKTRQNDRLINYIIEFEYAFYVNNTV